MSGGFPLLGSLANASTYTLAPSTPGANNTKGSWAQIVAALPFDVGAVLLPVPCFYNTSITALDIGIGASGSEQVIINNIVGSCQASYITFGEVLLPISIKAGTRVACRIQTTDTTANAIQPPFNITFFDASFVSPIAASVVDSIGFQSASTQGTTVTSGSGSKGSYAALTAATSYDYAGFFLAFDPQTAFNAQAFTVAVDIAIGASGSEKIILPDRSCSLRPGSAFSSGTISPLFAIPIPAGSRIAARAAASSSGAAMGITLYGLRQ